MSHESGGPDGVERFFADYDEGFLRHPERFQMAALDGETRVLEDGRVQITIGVNSMERLRFSVRGLENPVVTRDGEEIDASDAASGRYRIVIAGRPGEQFEPAR